jgi:hypothetical protein
VVEGLARFQSHFADYTDHYILIGGAACTVAMESVGESFRATKDLDIVLCVEVLNAAFVRSFWEFIRDGQYEFQQKATGEKQFYRFQKPSTESYPFMLELFSRIPDVLTPTEGSVLTPIPTDEEVSSLSAILLDDDYYAFLQAGKQIVDGVQIAGAEHLIPLKARAWIDLTERKDAGDQIDSKAIKKHKNDVFRLFTIVDPDFAGLVPDQVKSDLAVFLDRMKGEAVDLKTLGLGSQTLESVDAELRRIYGLGI